MLNRKRAYILIVFVLAFNFILPLCSLAQEKKEGEEIYTIKPGDTLWELSSRFLKDPFLWPKLWQRNPYITNPHLIYPGRPVLISPLETDKREEPRQVGGEERPKEETKEAELKREEPSPGEKKTEGPIEVKQLEEKAPVFREVRSAGFIGDMNYCGIGSITENRDGKILLCEGDVVYVKFKTREPILIGDRYTLFRPGDAVRNPNTGRKIGRKYNITGNIQIIDQDGGFYTAKIIEAFEEIFNGDRVQPYRREKMELGERK